MNNQDILFASLMGSKAIKTLERLDIVENEITKHVFPPIQFLPFRNITGIKEVNQAEQKYIWEADPEQSKEQQFFPLSFSFTEKGTQWLFPYEPLISVLGGNEIGKTKVARINDTSGNKLIGTIKQRIAPKDYEITITGVLIGKKLKGKHEDCYPKEQLRLLLNFLKVTKDVWVFCPLLELLGINKIAIEEFSFPFTKGENVQAYEIKAFSDFDYNLIIK
ncbi:DUF6046 domain-containing protein [Flavobacterium lacustre]|uniref:DUF6046 domain-containing protein n=1 Tax=Flavobacterium lacustre TaxID=3016339 RepID=UPI0022B73131|nr:DUF6046 domain-containing protein [Flavobacterium lacustre]